MTRVYLADARPEERSALRLLLLDLKMEVVGEASDWVETLSRAPFTIIDMLLVDWELLPNLQAAKALAQLRLICPKIIIVILANNLDASQREALSPVANAFIYKSDLPESVINSLRMAAAAYMLQTAAPRKEQSWGPVPQVDPETKRDDRRNGLPIFI